MYPGRWNRQGQRVVYASLNLSTAVLETLAHTDKTEIPDNLVKMEIEINLPFSSASTTEWQRFVSIRRSIAAAKTDPGIYSYSNLEIARLIPSVIIPEFNVVLNPVSKAFQSLVKIVSIEPFKFDPRLFPESAISKSIAEKS